MLDNPKSVASSHWRTLLTPNGQSGPSITCMGRRVIPRFGKGRERGNPHSVILLSLECVSKSPPFVFLGVRRETQIPPGLASMALISLLYRLLLGRTSPEPRQINSIGRKSLELWESPLSRHDCSCRTVCEKWLVRRQAIEF